jgi:hypothetical protein
MNLGLNSFANNSFGNVALNNYVSQNQKNSRSNLQIPSSNNERSRKDLNHNIISEKSNINLHNP